MKKKQRITTYLMKATVGAINYFQYKQTLLAMTFPLTLVSTFFKPGEFDDQAKNWVAELFGSRMHRKQGEKDWAELPRDVRRPWLMLYNFCKGYTHGFVKLHLSGPEKARIVEAFKVETTGEWFDKDKYIKSPLCVQPISPELVMKIEQPGTTL